MSTKIIAITAGALVTTVVTSYFVSRYTAKRVAKETAKEVSEAYLASIEKIVKEAVKDTPVNITVTCDEGIATKAEVVEKSPEEKL